jgi:glycine/D-amino acid oxidase-like deaminating enzyme
VGASIAARLAAIDGVRVTLLDADRPGHATSRWSFAWLNSNDKAPRHYHDLNHAGMRAWADLAPELDGAAWYRPAGHLELATTDAGRTELAARVRRLTGWGYPARLIDAAEAATLEPSLEPSLRHVPGAAMAWFGEEGYLLTEPLIDRLVARAVSQGAVLRTGEQGRVIGLDAAQVRTADGETLPADDIVCAAGRWTPELAAMASAGSPAGSPAGSLAGSPAVSPVPLADWDMPGATAPGLVVRAGPVASPGPVRLLHTPVLSLRPHPGGLVQMEAPDAAVDLHTTDADLRRWADELLRRARETVAGLDHAHVVDYKVCVRPMPADGQSIIGRLPGAETCYVAVTHSGVTLAAHLARLIAADLTGIATDLTGTPLTELAPYRPYRFGDGQRRKPGGAPATE